MKVYDEQGREVHQTTEVVNNVLTALSASDLLKLSIVNPDDNVAYTIGVRNFQGKAVIYLWSGGTTKYHNGSHYVRNDDSGLYHKLLVRTFQGQQIVFPDETGVAL